LANVSLLHYGCLELRPSAVAAAALSLAMRMLKPSYRRVVTLDRELEELTGYKPEDLVRGVDVIRSLI
jgi:cyclin A